jgi:hypothetical protein
MGDTPRESEVVTHLARWLIDRISRLLEPDEREAVLGDLAEMHATTAEYLRGVTGIVTRRQLAFWKDWRPWVGLVGYALPLGWLLGRMTRTLASTSATYSWLYFNNWTWSFVTIPGARRDLAHYAVHFFMCFVLLAAWSWTAGVALTSLSRRVLAIVGTFFFATVLVELSRVPSAFGNDGNLVVFTLLFYRVLWPAILFSVLVVLPAVLGMSRSVHAHSLSVIQAVILTTLMLVTTMWLFAGVNIGMPWLVRVAPYVLMVPAVHIVGGTIGVRRHQRRSA